MFILYRPSRILLLKLAVICVLEDQWPSTAELLSELVSIVIQAITVIVVAVSYILFYHSLYYSNINFITIGTRRTADGRDFGISFCNHRDA